VTYRDPFLTPRIDDVSMALANSTEPAPPEGFAVQDRVLVDQGGNLVEAVVTEVFRRHVAVRTADSRDSMTLPQSQVQRIDAATAVRRLRAHRVDQVEVASRREITDDVMGFVLRHPGCDLTADDARAFFASKGIIAEVVDYQQQGYGRTFVAVREAGAYQHLDLRPSEEMRRLAQRGLALDDKLHLLTQVERERAGFIAEGRALLPHEVRWVGRTAAAIPEVRASREGLKRLVVGGLVGQRWAAERIAQIDDAENVARQAQALPEEVIATIEAKTPGIIVSRTHRVEGTRVVACYSREAGEDEGEEGEVSYDTANPDAPCGCSKKSRSAETIARPGDMAPETPKDGAPPKDAEAGMNSGVGGLFLPGPNERYVSRPGAPHSRLAAHAAELALLRGSEDGVGDDAIEKADANAAKARKIVEAHGGELIENDVQVDGEAYSLHRVIIDRAKIVELAKALRDAGVKIGSVDATSPEIDAELESMGVRRVAQLESAADPIAASLIRSKELVPIVNQVVTDFFKKAGEDALRGMPTQLRSALVTTALRSMERTDPARLEKLRARYTPNLPPVNTGGIGGAFKRGLQNVEQALGTASARSRQITEQQRVKQDMRARGGGLATLGPKQAAQLKVGKPMLFRGMAVFTATGTPSEIREPLTPLAQKPVRGPNGVFGVPAQNRNGDLYYIAVDMNGPSQGSGRPRAPKPADTSTNVTPSQVQSTQPVSTTPSTAGRAARSAALTRAKPKTALGEERPRFGNPPAEPPPDLFEFELIGAVGRLVRVHAKWKKSAAVGQTGEPLSGANIAARLKRAAELFVMREVGEKQPGAARLVRPFIGDLASASSAELVVAVQYENAIPLPTIDA
jgi:hypothetical protein